MRRLQGLLFPNWLLVPITIVCAVAVGEFALTSRAFVANAASPYAISGVRQPSGPITYWIDERFTADEASVVEAAFATWESDPSSAVTFVFMGATATTDRGVDDGRNVVVRSTAPVVSDGTSALAVTVRVASDDARTYRDTDIVLDFSGGPRWSTEGEARTQDLQTLMAHEVGHMLGLDHVSDPEQLMYPVLTPGRIDRRWLRWGDAIGLAALYPGSGSIADRR